MAEKKLTLADVIQLISRLARYEEVVKEDFIRRDAGYMLMQYYNTSERIRSHKDGLSESALAKLDQLQNYIDAINVAYLHSQKKINSTVVKGKVNQATFDNEKNSLRNFIAHLTKPSLMNNKTFMSKLQNSNPEVDTGSQAYILACVFTLAIGSVSVVGSSLLIGYIASTIAAPQSASLVFCVAAVITAIIGVKILIGTAALLRLPREPDISPAYKALNDSVQEYHQTLDPRLLKSQVLTQAYDNYHNGAAALYWDLQ